MYIVTQNGKKLSVDDSSIDYKNDGLPLMQTVGLYDDATNLDDVWILELNRRGLHRFKLEFVEELLYYHEPTKEEILWAMSANGLSTGDVVFVKHGYELSFGDD